MWVQPACAVKALHHHQAYCATSARTRFNNRHKLARLVLTFVGDLSGASLTPQQCILKDAAEAPCDLLDVTAR